MQLEIISRLPDCSRHDTPLLFVHGAWHGAWCWDEYFLPYFAQHGYAAHAVSLRGHGASEGRGALRWASIANYVEDVAQAARQFTQPPIVIGHSLGGFVVQKYLEKYSAPAAVLVASLPPHGALLFFLRFCLKHPLAFGKTLVTLTPYHMVSSLGLTRENFFSPDLPLNEVARHYARIQAESLIVAWDIVVGALPLPKRINMPMLVLGAANDMLFTVAEVAFTAQAYRAEASVFADMAHDMMLEPKWQEVADRMLSWFAAHDW